jgi:hypothetical protein
MRLGVALGTFTKVPEMRDHIIRFFDGPKDGEAVKLPPDFVPVRADDRAVAALPPYIELGPVGRYEFKRETKRYEWVGRPLERV